MENRLRRSRPGSGLRDVIDPLDVVGHADAAVVTGVLAVRLDDLDGAAKLLPLDIHALIPPEIFVAQPAGIRLRCKDQQGVGGRVVAESRLHIQIVTELAAVSADRLGGGIGQSVNLVALRLFLCRPRLLVKFVGLWGGFKNIIKIAHGLSLLCFLRFLSGRLLVGGGLLLFRFFCRGGFGNARLCRLFLPALPNFPQFLTDRGAFFGRFSSTLGGSALLL